MPFCWFCQEVAQCHVFEFMLSTTTAQYCISVRLVKYHCFVNIYRFSDMGVSAHTLLPESTG